ncbi:hypothetical protein GGF32_008707 [Allomyces javanicus]|nr:hypothetical protein GGF32_008707 [Allomyces javanicus]
MSASVTAPVTFLPGNQVPVNFWSRRSAVFGRRYMVASSQPFATHAGVKILESGGNAADAAVAVAATLNVTEPGSCGIGGDMFCLFFNAKDGTVKAINGSGHSPQALTLDLVREHHPDATDRVPANSPLAITVPGAVAGWADTVTRFGSGKFSLGDLLAPAIDLAENGYPVSQLMARQWAGSQNRLLAASPNGAEMLLRDPVTGEPRAPREGEIMRLPNLAHTLRIIAAQGPAGFYTGPVAEAIVDVVQSLGGVMTLGDLAMHRSAFTDPISIDYAGHRLWECAPNGQGLVALIALGILDRAHALGLMPDRMEDQLAAKIRAHPDQPNVPTQYAHYLIQALRFAFADAQAWITDPAVLPPEETIATLLSPAVLDVRARQLVADTPDLAPAPLVYPPGGAPRFSSDTVYFCVGDAEGNACSFIFSNYQGFGNAAVPKGFGFTLQNRGANFDVDPRSINVVAPHKRPYHTIIPAMLTTPTSSNAKLISAYGVMGGFNQPQGHVQVLLQYLAGKATGLKDPQLAIDSPRLCLQPEENVEGVLEEDGDQKTIAPVDVEEGMLTAEQFAELRAKGHVLREVKGAGRGVFGRGQWAGRLRNENGGETGWIGASDGRADGCAFGW